MAKQKKYTREDVIREMMTLALAKETTTAERFKILECLLTHMDTGQEAAFLQSLGDPGGGA